ncbi:MAG: LacI family DNA-binding transcriptional regulator [Lentisphaeria bacterium]|nr:LacI family transcriptional regulator [Lentisphaeria bacterium]NQZ67258.1 LacI family DNA-binding transcriptional regulator [Lentisphaeria bacterium]
MPNERKSTTTMQDIAKRCGVSHTTVSFVLRGREMGISETTRQKVLYEAICLDYQTRADQRIDSGKIRVSLLVPEYDSLYHGDRYYCRLLACLIEQEEETGVKVIVQASNKRDIVRTLYKSICEDRVDLVMPICIGEDELDLIIDLSPVPVLTCEVWTQGKCSYIGYDSEWIGAEAARQFYAAGHRKAAILKCGELISERKKSFTSEWTKLGGEMVAGHDVSDLSMKDSYEDSLHFFKAGHDFTALFCISDSVAMGAMQAIYECGLSVPDDISIIACDDDGYSQFAHPGISTFRLNENEHSKQLIDEFKRLIHDGIGLMAIANKAEFIKRGSLKTIDVAAETLKV